MVGGGVTAAPATAATASTAATAVATAMVRFELMPFLSTVSGPLQRRDYAYLAADVGHFDLGEVGGPGGAELGIAVGAPRPDAPQQLGEILVRRARTQRRAEVVAAQREQARVQAAFGGQSSTRASAAERLRHRGDHADLAGAVAIAPTEGGRVGRFRRDGLERPDGVDARDD